MHEIFYHSLISKNAEGVFEEFPIFSHVAPIGMIIDDERRSYVPMYF